MIGRVKTVLVNHLVGKPIAIVSTVPVRLLPSGTERLKVTGPVTFNPIAQTHVEQTVLSAVDLVTDALGLPRRGFGLSVINLGATSAKDLGVEVEGFSLDAAIALGMLSAATRLPIRPDTLVTGHVASPAGDIRAVRSLPEKLAAAIAFGDISHFLYPAPNEDQSLEALAPGERSRIIGALNASVDKIWAHPVGNLAELVRLASTEQGRLLAALKTGYFTNATSEDAPAAATLLLENLEHCFWKTLEEFLYGGQSHQARHLITLRLRHQIRRRQYPHGIGSRLSALVASVPPALRRRRGFFPLAPTSLCFEIGRLAAADSELDAAELLWAALGKSLCSKITPAPHADRLPQRASSQALDAMIDAISAERLAQDIGIPADEARAAFVLPGVIVEDYDLFLDTIVSFHVALMRAVAGAPAAARPDEALALLEHAYTDSGGLAGARSEAMFAVEGGMRKVLDRMTEQFKTEQRYKRVHRILKESLDPLDWDARVELMRGLIERLRIHLPADWNNVSAGRFVRRQDDLVRAYVGALDRVHGLIRTL